MTSFAEWSRRKEQESEDAWRRVSAEISAEEEERAAKRVAAWRRTHEGGTQPEGSSSAVPPGGEGVRHQPVPTARPTFEVVSIEIELQAAHVVIAIRNVA